MLIVMSLSKGVNTIQVWLIRLIPQVYLVYKSEMQMTSFSKKFQPKHGLSSYRTLPVNRLRLTGILRAVADKFPRRF